jgi:hypothetical protein
MISLRHKLGHMLGIGLLTVALVARTLAQAPSVAAGVPSESIVETWLRSGDPRLVAWGAHDILLARDVDLVPELVTLASQWQPLSRRALDAKNRTELSPEQIDERDAMSAILDALIQMNAPVPADTLRNLAPDFGNDIAVLLSGMPADQAGSVSFDLYRLQAEHIYALQYVSAALLALHPVPGFAADLLSNLTVHATVRIVLPGAGQFGDVIAGDCFSLPEAPREGWPTTGQYFLSHEKGNGALLLVGGIDPVYVTREQSTRYLGDFCHLPIVHLGSNQRLRLIAEMLNVSPETIPWQTDPTVQIEFLSQERFEDALLSFIQKQQEKYRATVAALAARDLLTPSEAQESFPELDLKLIDLRGHGAAPIPDLLNLPSHVRLASAPF